MMDIARRTKTTFFDIVSIAFIFFLLSFEQFESGSVSRLLIH